METFSALLALCAGNSLVTGEFPAQRPVTRSFDVFFDWVNNRKAGDLRRHGAHYNVTVMHIFHIICRHVYETRVFYVNHCLMCLFYLYITS